MSKKWASLLLFVCLMLATKDGVHADEICIDETFQGRCPSDSVIDITRAWFGQHQVGSCISTDIGYLGCGKDAQGDLDSLCSGRQTCDVLVDQKVNPELYSENTCIKEITSYLDLEYRCIKVTQGHRCGEYSSVTSNHGALASVVTDSSGCGSMTSPWSIKMTAGQKIQITLADYGWKSAEHVSSACRPYAYIVESSAGVNQTICGGSERERHVYTSTSDHVLIQISPYGTRQANFVLWFEVNGCPDITPPAHAWYKRDGDSAVIGCEWSEHSWHLTCEGNAWVGVVGNCSDGGAVEKPTHKESFTISPVLSIGMITGLGVLILALLCVLCIGCICLRRNQNSSKPERRTDTLTGQEQAFLYHPGRPVPLGDPQATMVQATIVHAKPGQTGESLHIWEQPLPQEPAMVCQPGMETYQNQSTIGTMPVHGTMTGPTTKRAESVGESESQSGTWGGTKAFYDPTQGWQNAS